MTKKNIIAILVSILVLLGSSISLSPHCQVPCGIYDDQARVKAIAEHITTIEKAMKQIAALSKATPVNYNQIVRWVTNKEKHANQLSDIVTYYFMSQRLKPVAPSDSAKLKTYLNKLETLHHLLFYTMKAKQTTDLAHIAKLRKLLKKFKGLYFVHKHKH